MSKLFSSLMKQIKDLFEKKPTTPSPLRISSKPQTNNRTLKTELFYVVGEHYHKSNIGKLACKNPDWQMTAKQAISKGKAGKRIYRYNYIHKPVKLVPEPDNPHDKNAIFVLIAGEKVGYISSMENEHVKDILSNREVKYISAFIGGGAYKIAEADGTFSRFEDDLSVKVKIGYV